MTLAEYTSAAPAFKATATPSASAISSLVAPFSSAFLECTAMQPSQRVVTATAIAAARMVVAKMKDTSKLTDRERAYLNAVKLLYSDGDKRARECDQLALPG